VPLFKQKRRIVECAVAAAAQIRKIEIELLALKADRKYSNIDPRVLVS